MNEKVNELPSLRIKVSSCVKQGELVTRSKVTPYMKRPTGGEALCHSRLFSKGRSEGRVKGCPDAYLEPTGHPLCGASQVCWVLFLGINIKGQGALSWPLCPWDLALLVPHYTLGTQKLIKAAPCSDISQWQPFCFGEGQTGL